MNRGHTLPAFDPTAVRQALVPFKLGGGIPPDGPIQAYCQYYPLHRFIVNSDNDSIGLDFGYVDIRGFRIAVQYFKPVQVKAAVKGTVWLIHGYTDHVANFHHVIRFLVEHHYAVFTFDLPGHGVSNGNPLAIDEFHTYTDVLAALVQRFAACLPTPHFAVGQSTGGAILMDAVLLNPKLREQKLWQQVVLLAPLLRVPFWQMTRLRYNLLKRFKSHIKRQFRANTADQNFMQFLKHQDPLQCHFLSAQWVGAMFRWVHQMEALPINASSQPIVVIQGDQDKTVDYRYNLPFIRSRFKSAEIKIIQGASHHLVNEADYLRQQVFSNLLQAFLS